MDEELKQAMILLLENKWIIRNNMSDEYMLIRRCEKKLQAFFREKCGWLLIVNQRFYKLEKIPAKAQRVMGIEEFQSIDDYVLLCCTLAFLEEQEIDEQFLLSNLCEALMEYYPNDEAIDKLSWESYNCRRALIRVINYLLDINVLRLVEDNSETFLSGDFSSGSFSGEALYEVTVLARYFLCSYPRDLQSYENIDSLYNADMRTDGDAGNDVLRHRRNKVYRELLLSPVYYKTEDTAEEFLYLRKNYQRIREEFIRFFDLNLELYNDCALAVTQERNTWFKELFPTRLKGAHDVILHFAALYRTLDGWQDKKVLTINEFTEVCAQTAKVSASGWTKEFRQMSREKLAQSILDELINWQMAVSDADQQIITLQSALFRTVGKYPDDYIAGGGKGDK